MSVKSFKINDKIYYNMKDLTPFLPEFFYGCKTKPRHIIQKKNIPETEYIYANLKKDEWNLTTEECKKAQLLVTKDWLDRHFFSKIPIGKPIKQNTVQNDIQVEGPTGIALASSRNLVENTIVSENNTNQSDFHNNNDNNNENVNSTDDECENCPPELYLEDEEKFKDANGNIIEINTVGEKNEDNIYFKVKDVMNGFNINNLHTIIIDKNSGYKKNIDYKYFFIRVKSTKSENDTIKKSLYLTYEGILRMLFISRNENATLFRKWATKKLFTIQMGQQDEKQKLGTQLLKVDSKTFKAVFDSYSSTFPCIYLLSFGKVKDLRETFNIQNDINNDLSVYKYGFTDDIERRLKENTLEYGKMKNVNVVLSIFHMIDVKYISKAETDIKNLFEAFGKSLIVEASEQTLKKRKELVILNSKEYKHIKEFYNTIGTKYIGSTQYLQNKIEELQNEIKIINLNKELELQKLIHKNEMLNKDNEMLKKDNHLQKLMYENEMLKRHSN